MYRYAALLLPVFFAACTDDNHPLVSAPITVETDEGPVTCQLYSGKVVLWDKATTRPQSMTDDAANRVCKAEGELRRGEALPKKGEVQGIDPIVSQAEL